ncbi:fringe glycosyltransferase-like [Tropilaelaps mercedesae]|uniref:Fringe glycosyltransferase-like n=1 Tax=Tropilaelaps mercedesae TaxID=418985 RepID=A0A1V9XXE1_9ACAR|nr:fringe glycosyltransferase-like [Tropilaelaps mercedesae]
MDTVTSWLVSPDSDKVAMKFGHTSQNLKTLVQIISICFAVCLYMLLLLAWPHLTLVNDKSIAVNSPRSETLGLSFLDDNTLPQFQQHAKDSVGGITMDQTVTVSKQKHVAQTEKDDLPTTTEAFPESQLTLEDLFISVKTTRKFHHERLNIIINTWFRLARDQTYFFTDADDEEFSRKTYNHLVNTRCPSSHNRRALCCKMAVEFDRYLESRKKWWCHFDDDNYVNVPRLLRSLQEFDHRQEWYLGKTSIKDPLEIPGPRNSHFGKSNVRSSHGSTPAKIVSFWFGTGGAGFCISQALALKMKPLASNGRFSSVGESIRLPDDVTMGFLVEVLLGRQLTVLSNFHSHLESLGYIEQESFRDQISFSYSRAGNVLSLSKAFDHRLDPTRFISVHCYLFPQFDVCRRTQRHQFQLEKQSQLSLLKKNRQMKATAETPWTGAKTMTAITSMTTTS